jgi:transposase
VKRKKEDALKSNGTFNYQANKVKDSLFLEQDFFDPCDLLQVKYEMLRKVGYEGWSISKAAKTFGLTRPSYYTAFSSYQSNGLAGLAPQKRGPKNPHKLSISVIEFIHSILQKNHLSKLEELADQVQKEFGISIHPRSINRIINPKKKL